MDSIPVYAVNDFGPLMKGMVIGGIGILHVFLAQLAIGGGLLLLYFARLAQQGREPDARTFIDGMFQVLVLVSFVLGALTGVAIWFTTIQVGARTIGLTSRRTSLPPQRAAHSCSRSRSLRRLPRSPGSFERFARRPGVRRGSACTNDRPRTATRSSRPRQPRCA